MFNFGNEPPTREPSHTILYFVILTLTHKYSLTKSCNPSGKIKGRKPPPGQCNR
ncbi:hypothetical protein LguiB_010879 [Lonicera macranthoides]